jgi:hypothetical protein
MVGMVSFSLLPDQEPMMLHKALLAVSLGLVIALIVCGYGRVVQFAEGGTLMALCVAATYYVPRWRLYAILGSMASLWLMVSAVLARH